LAYFRNIFDLFGIIVIEGTGTRKPKDFRLENPLMTDSDDMQAPKPAPSTLGERIKAVRIEWDWAQDELAEILRVDQASISFWERDKIKPSGAAMVALAALFRTTADALETGQGFVVPKAPGRGEGKRKSRPLPRGICLPVGQLPGQVVVVDLATGYLSVQELSEAMINLGQYTKDGRKIWIVVE
jgi:DNA-binding XRE family transcriptional regulator